MSATVTIYSDLACPWALLTVHRLRRARDTYGLDVIFDQRAWPLEWVNEAGTPRHILEPETAVLAQYEPELFSRFQGASWPSTLLPAFELVAAARRAFGLRAAEDVDYQLRLRFFRDSADLSLRHELRHAAEAAGLDPDKVIDVWHREPVRADVVADYEHSQQMPIQGSPQIFWPDGSTTHNPGMTNHEWLRGIPRVGPTDPDEPARLLREHVGR